MLTEGERGILGVGFPPARVLGGRRVAADRRPPAAEESPSRLSCAGSSGGSSMALGVRGRIVVEEDGRGRASTCSGDDVAVLIGRQGQTIDAIQYLVNAIAHRRTATPQGSRRRRGRLPRSPPATLEAMASGPPSRRGDGQAGRARADDAVERKVVHEKLKRARRRSASEGDGAEPLRRRPTAGG